MYRIVVCDDNDIQAKKLCEDIRKSLEEVTNQVEIFKFNSGEDLLEAELMDIDIFFLDIQMDKITGMDVAKEIRKDNDKSEIIFETALTEYVREGYKVRAYRYLLKPIKFEELKENILSCVEDIIKRHKNFMIIENKEKTYKIIIGSIKYIEVRKKELTLHTTEDSYKTKNSLENIELELKKYNFFRCHKGYLINMEHIDCISKKFVTIDGEEIPVSRHRMATLKKKLAYTLGEIIC